MVKVTLVTGMVKEAPGMDRLTHTPSGTRDGETRL
jgi:hypothetical protein